MISKLKSIIVVTFVFIPHVMMAQCSVTLDEATHIDCYGDNTGAITVNVTSTPATTTYFWTGPLGFSSIVEDISGLLAGDYKLIVNDASTSCIDSFNYTIHQPLQITAEFTLSNLCETGDSVVVLDIAFFYSFCKCRAKRITCLV